MRLTAVQFQLPGMHAPKTTPFSGSNFGMTDGKKHDSHGSALPVAGHAGSGQHGFRGLRVGREEVVECAGKLAAALRVHVGLRGN